MTAAPEPFDRRILRASDSDRERVAQVLNQALEEGRLTPAEAHERITALYATKTLGDLEPLTVDLPGHAELVPRSPTAPEVSGSGAGSAVAPRLGGTPGSAFAVGVLSGATRAGTWVVPRQFTALAFMGGVDLDLSKARFAHRDTVITAVAIMGGVDIVVPDDITVVVSGVGIMGAFDDSARVEGPPGCPVVRVNGVAIMGGVDVKRKKRKAGEVES